MYANGCLKRSTDSNDTDDSTLFKRPKTHSTATTIKDGNRESRTSETSASESDGVVLKCNTIDDLNDVCASRTDITSLKLTLEEDDGPMILSKTDCKVPDSTRLSLKELHLDGYTPLDMHLMFLLEVPSTFPHLRRLHPIFLPTHTPESAKNDFSFEKQICDKKIVEEAKRWFHKNEFFKATPLNGWAFIYEAKQLKVVVFWYIIILSFIGFTIYNAHQVTIYYLSSPTTHHILLHSATGDVFMPNITITAVMPLNDFLYTALPWTYYNDLVTGLLIPIQHHYMILLPLYPREPWFKANQDPSLIEFSNMLVLNNWKSQMNTSSQSLIDYWLDLLGKEPNQQDERQQVADVTTSIYNGLVTQRTYTFLKLIVLHALKEDTDPRAQLWTYLGYSKIRDNKGLSYYVKLLDMLQSSVAAAPQLLAERPLSAKYLLKHANLTARQLLVDVMSDLWQIFQIEMTPHGSATLRDWSYDLGGVVPTQKLTLQLKFPPFSKKINFKLHSYQKLWHNYVAQAYLTLFNHTFIKKDIIGGANDLYCQEGFPFALAVKTRQIELVSAFKQNMKMWISVPHSEHLYAEYGYKNSYLIAPSITYKSYINNCSSITLESCLLECEKEQSLTRCGCLPWTVAMANGVDLPKAPICDQSCFHAIIIEHCQEECSQAINNSCSLQTMHVMTHDKTDASGMPELVEVDMQILEMHAYAEINKEYKLTSNDYFSMLGGSFEFWSAMDVMGLLHLAIVIIWHFTDWLVGKLTKANRSSNSNVEKTLESTEQVLREQISAFRSNLRPPQHQLDKKRKFINWVKRNKIFTGGNMAASSFINAAESAVEIVLWYLLIAIFGIITGYNSYNTIRHFTSGSTRIDVEPTITPIGLPNITIKLYLPYVILNSYKISVPDYANITDSYELDDKQEILIYSMGDEQSYNSVERLMTKWTQDLAKPWTQLITVNHKPIRAAPVDSFSDIRVRREYKKAYAKHTAAIDQLIRQSPVKIGEEDKSRQYLLDMRKYFNTSFLTPNIEQAIFKLILLDSVKKGNVPGSQLGVKRNVNAVQILEKLGCTVNELFLDTMETLSHLLLITGADVMLTDIDLGVSNKSFMIELQLNFNSNMEKTIVSIVSSLHTWLADLKQYKELHQQLGKPFDDSIAMLAHDVDTVFADNFAHKDSTHLALDLLVPNSNTINSVGEYLQDYSIGLKWLYKSPHKTSCGGNSYEWCVNECELRAYKELCHCIPWSMYALDKTSSLCFSPCTITDDNCHKICSDKLCEQYEATVRELFLEFDYAELFRFELSMQKQLYFEFTEQYEDSLGTFLAKLGNLLDFWMGICTMFIVYLLIYVVQKFADCIESRNKNKTSSKAQIQKTRAELSRLSAHVQRSMKELRTAAEAGRLHTNRSKTGWLWLKSNSFFTTTTITGFGFIAGAKSVKEATMWWMLVVIFAGITVHNVYGSINEHLVQGALTYTTLSRENHLQYGNFTIGFPLSLVELTDQFPTGMRYYYSVYAERYAGYPIPSAFACPMLDLWYETERKARETLVHRWLDFDSWSTVNFTYEQPNQGTYPEIYQHWLAKLQSSHDALMSFLERNKHTEQNMITQRQFLDILDMPLKGRDPHHGFLLLQAFNSGHNPQKALYDLLKSTNPEDVTLADTSKKSLVDKFLPTTDGNATSKHFAAPVPNHISKLLNGYTVNEIYSSIQKQLLQQIIYFKIPDEPNVQIDLMDWKYEKSDTDSKTPNSLLKQRLVFHITMPPRTNRHELEIKMYSLLHLWNKRIMSALYSHFALDDMLHEVICIENHMTMKELIEKHQEFKTMVVLQQTHSYKNALYITTDRGNIIKCEQLSQCNIVLQPSAGFMTSIKNCSQLSPMRCIEQCENAIMLSECGCQPWNKLYLKQEGPVCLRPCLASVEQCHEQCEQELLHTCRSVIYQPKVETLPNIDDEDAIFSIKIVKQNSTHIMHTASYVSFGSLVVKISGLLDLWLGINLFSIIHLIIYIIKQLANANQCKKANSKVHNHEKDRNQKQDAQVMTYIERLEHELMKQIEMISKEIDLEIVQNKKEGRE